MTRPGAEGLRRVEVKAPDEVSAMPGRQALGRGVRRISAARGCSRTTVRRRLREERRRHAFGWSSVADARGPVRGSEPEPVPKARSRTRHGSMIATGCRWTRRRSGGPCRHAGPLPLPGCAVRSADRLDRAARPVTPAGSTSPSRQCGLSGDRNLKSGAGRKFIVWSPPISGLPSSCSLRGPEPSPKSSAPSLTQRMLGLLVSWKW